MKNDFRPLTDALGYLLLMSPLIPATAAPPDTARENFTYELHGETLVDPYLWLEGRDAPEAAPGDADLDERVSAWTDDQNAYTRAVLESLDGREALESELAALLSLDGYGIPQSAGNQLFYTLRQGDQAQPVLYVANADGEAPRVLLDVNSLDETGLLALDWFRPSPDGRYVAFGTYEAGDEQTTANVLETESGEWLDDQIDGRVDTVDWLDDNERFVVRRLSSESPYSGQISIHRLGTRAADDSVLFDQFTEGPLATTWGPYPIVSRDGRWLVVIYFTGTDSNDVWYYDLDEWRESGDLVRRDLLVGEDALTAGFIEDAKFYALTTLGASNKRVILFDFESEDPAAYRELIATDDGAVIDSISSAAGRIVVNYLASAYSRISVFNRDGRRITDIQLPGIGSAAIGTHPDRDSAWLRYESFSEPEGIYRVDLALGSTTLWRRPDLPVDIGNLTVTQMFYPSKDGTRIPIFLVHRRDLELNGDNPTLLYGYGGFDISLTPNFTAAWLPWLAQGGVYAVANLRGGGEFGADWHRAGMLANKQNVFDDFYAAAEWLIESGYTRVERLGIRGGSNGGLLTGVAITQRPELFSAAIVAVPLLDMLRYQNFLMARYWVPEYGTAENAQQFEFIRAYSPYQHVTRGVEYPATLLTAGENDTRVHALHARKMAAALQDASASDLDEEPIMLWVDRSAGHGQGKPLAIRVSEAADQVAFMAWQLGLEFF